MALAPLSPLVGALVALGLAALLTLLTLALVKFLSAAPVIGGWIADKAQAAENAISNALGRAFQGIDSFIGGCIHHLARFMDRVWHTIAATPHLLLQLAETIARISGVAAAARSLAHTLEREFHGIEHGIRDLRKIFRGIDHLVKRLERDLTKGIGHDLRLAVNTLTGEYHTLTRKTIPGIRSRVKTVEGEIASVEDWIGMRVGQSRKAWLIALGTAILGALGLGGLRCGSLGNILNKRGCGLWNDLENLLTLAVIAGEIASLEELVKAAQGVTEEIALGVEELLQV